MGRPSSREVRIRVPSFLQSILVGEPSKKGAKRALLGDLDGEAGSRHGTISTACPGDLWAKSKEATSTWSHDQY